MGYETLFVITVIIFASLRTCHGIRGVDTDFYRGCFWDNANDRVLSDLIFCPKSESVNQECVNDCSLGQPYCQSNSRMTLDLCRSICEAQNFRFYSLQAGRQCFCGGDFSQYDVGGQALFCDYPCTGNNTQLCGGEYRMDVYEIPVPIIGSACFHPGYVDNAANLSPIDPVFSGGSILSYGDACPEGYLQEGSSALFCQLMGGWNVSLPTCTRQCSDPPVPMFGEIRIGGPKAVYLAGDSFLYICTIDSGKAFATYYNLKCSEEGDWTGNGLNVVCPDPTITLPPSTTTTSTTTRSTTTVPKTTVRPTIQPTTTPPPQTTRLLTTKAETTAMTTTQKTTESQSTEKITTKYETSLPVISSTAAGSTIPLSTEATTTISVSTNGVKNTEAHTAQTTQTQNISTVSSKVTDIPSTVTSSSLEVSSTNLASTRIPSTGTDTPSTVTNIPSTFTNTPPTVTNTPPTVTNTPPTVTNTPPTVISTPPRVTNTPSTVTNTRSTVTNTPPTATNTPPTVTNTPPTVTITRSTVTNTRSTVTNTPSSVTNTPPTLINTPPRVTNTPSTVTNTPSTVSGTPLVRSSAVMQITTNKQTTAKATEEVTTAGPVSTAAPSSLPTTQTITGTEATNLLTTERMTQSTLPDTTRAPTRSFTGITNGGTSISASVADTTTTNNATGSDGTASSVLIVAMTTASSSEEPERTRLRTMIPRLTKRPDVGGIDTVKTLLPYLLVAAGLFLFVIIMTFAAAVTCGRKMPQDKTRLTHGRSNGQVNGRTNGQSNGRMNGHANGHASSVDNNNFANPSYKEGGAAFDNPAFSDDLSNFSGSPARTGFASFRESTTYDTVDEKGKLSASPGSPIAIGGAPPTPPPLPPPPLPSPGPPTLPRRQERPPPAVRRLPPLGDVPRGSYTLPKPSKTSPKWKETPSRGPSTPPATLPKPVRKSSSTRKEPLASTPKGAISHSELYAAINKKPKLKRTHAVPLPIQAGDINTIDSSYLSVSGYSTLDYDEKPTASNTDTLRSNASEQFFDEDAKQLATRL